MLRIFKGASKVYRKRKFWYDQRYKDNYSFIHINKCGGTSVESVLGIPKIHDTASHRIKVIGKKKWDNRFTVSLIRHPYSKVVSHYNYRVKTNKTNLKSSPIDLNDWVKLSYGEKNKRFYNVPLMFEPSFNWLTYKDHLVVDCIVKLEEIDSEWPMICENLKIKYRPLPKVNQTSHNRIQAAFDKLDDEALSIIHSHFSIDFSEFKYDKLSRL